MNFPLYSYDLISLESHLIAALVIGCLFGFILERGGLGNAKKLIGQFTLKDMTVFKVMFSAIVTAMFGLYFFNHFGLIKMELISFNDSYLLPQALGGFLLGVGFVVAGYCPGTSVVAMATGKLDALSCFIGLFIGAWIFVLAYEFITPLYFSGHLVNDNLTDVFALQETMVMLAITVIAIACFYFSEKLELVNE